MFLETNIYNNIIFENYYESENEEQFIKKIYLKKNKQNYFKILNKIVFKKIEQQNKNDFLILNKYFKKWFNLTKSFNKELIIIPAYVSKGLEFDSVIVFNDLDNSYRRSERNLLYVACTRCQHELIIYN